jgi:hypothetical protein
MYRPAFIYKNSIFEQSIDMGDDRQNFAYFNYMRKAPPPRPDFLTAPMEELDLNGFPASVVQETYPMLDGWYTQISAGVLYKDVNNQLVKIKRGQLVIRFGDTTNTVYVALVNQPLQDNDDHWHQLSTFDNTVIDPQTGSLLGVYLNDVRNVSPDSDWFPIYVKQEFFVKYKFNRLYQKRLSDYIDKYGIEAGRSFKQLRIKDRAITVSAADGDYIEAQKFLQSTEFALLEYIEI